ncbi:response regulator [Altererythrobacter soli]|uniref:Response regulator n=1 Tax=Croceibacterium soli TaxID=1739690 RepID=A0A6I4UTU5_9SPHN|nr:response regulator transcription factor [Croceibacterium soli]MXP41916.1 response regulator [Croceibacterium soli]
MRIAILEDEPSLATQLTEIVASAGHTCFPFQSGHKLMKFLRYETVDMILLDWNVPDVSGLEVIRWVTEQLKVPPRILMITVRSLEEDVVAAFRAGADDYITKPLQPAALLARMDAIFRRTSEPPKGRVEQFGDYRFDTHLNEVRIKEETAPLTSKEFALALLLFRNLNRSLSRSYLLESVWGQSANVQTRTLDTHISKVRAKLNLRAGNGFRVVPLYGYGYRLEQSER